MNENVKLREAYDTMFKDLQFRTKQVRDLQDELEKVKAERDAAIHALAKYNDCKTCDQNCGGCNFELEPAPPCDAWKWKGVN